MKRSFVALLLLSFACAPGPGAVRERLVTEEFETQCDDGLPCGWAQVTGEPGAARYVETIHPGEHGLALIGSGVNVRGPGGPTRPAIVSVGSLQASLVARCDPGAGLTIDLAVADATDAGAFFVDTFEGRTTPGQTWEQRTVVNLTSTTALSDGGFGGSFGGTRTIRVLAVALSKTGAGQCEIASFRVDDIGAIGDDFVGGC